MLAQRIRSISHPLLWNVHPLEDETVATQCDPDSCESVLAPSSVTPQSRRWWGCSTTSCHLLIFFMCIFALCRDEHFIYIVSTDITLRFIRSYSIMLYHLAARRLLSNCIVCACVCVPHFKLFIIRIKFSTVPLPLTAGWKAARWPQKRWGTHPIQPPRLSPVRKQLWILRIRQPLLSKTSF